MESGAPEFRPTADGSLTRYNLFLKKNNGLTWDLYVTDINGETPAILIDSAIAYGYDWRPDSRALAYQKMDNPSEDISDICLGTLQEAVIVDDQNQLSANPVESLHGNLASHQLSNNTSSLAGMLFQPFSKVVYDDPDKILFSTFNLTLPTTKIKDDPPASVFSYDRNMESITDLLPPELSKTLNDSVGLFTLSPDHTAILLPTYKHRFMIYTLRQSSFLNPISENEAFGEKDKWVLIPAWKGNDRITCIVSSKSHFFESKESQQPLSHKVIEIDRNGNLKNVLFENWPNLPVKNANEGQNKQADP